MAAGEFIKLLKNSVWPSKLSTDESELEIRCPYCGDSIKHANKGHLYISTQPPYMYRCVKCESSGIVSERFLHDIGCYNNDVLLTLLSENRIYKQAHRETTNYIYTPKKSIIKLIEPTGSEQEASCVKYFNNRYNTNFTAEELIKKFKAVLDIDAFVEHNKLYFELKFFDLRQAIGFLSSDKNYIVFRDISGTQPIRYYNLCLVDKDIPNKSKQYTIAEPVDQMIDKINLIMTEGIFDIIGVYNKFYKNSEIKNNIFVATCGKSYGTAINKYLSMGFLNLDIYIYSDNDVNFTWYKQIKDANPLFENAKITIYYNKLGKDFGVPEDQIELRKVVI